MTRTTALPIYFQHLLDGILARTDRSPDNGYRVEMINRAIDHVERMANALTVWATTDEPGPYPLPRGVDAFSIGQMTAILNEELEKVREDIRAGIKEAEEATPFSHINHTAIVIGICGIGSYFASVGTVLAWVL